MKIFFLLFSFFMLFISCMPCGDSMECNSHPEQKISSSADHQNHNHGVEACSPFCSCSCCAVSIVPATFFKFQAHKFNWRFNKYPLINFSIKSSISPAIWQPPRLS
ncbi:MAG: DUF6660 family protein [Ferruginibacter sp.]